MQQIQPAYKTTTHNSTTDGPESTLSRTRFVAARRSAGRDAASISGSFSKPAMSNDDDDRGAT